MKYEKPLARDLSEIPFAAGACVSGAFVGTCTNIAGGIAGDCAANGENAGTCSGAGTAVGDTCVPGPLGVAANCAPSGTFASPF